MMMTIDEIRITLHKIVDVFDFYDRISRMHDCNDCSRKRCEYAPDMGGQVRINCPLWEGGKNGTV